MITTIFILYVTILYVTILYVTILYVTILYVTILYVTILYVTILYVTTYSIVTYKINIVIYMITTIFILYVTIEYVKELISIYNKLFHEGYYVVKNYLHNNDLKKVNLYLKEKNYNNLKKYLLEDEHFRNKITLILYNHFNNEQGLNYVILDYFYILDGSSINSWHRDYTSSKIFNNLKYPSYSMIIYLSPSNLEVVSSSHENDKNIYLCYKSFKNIDFNIGDSIIFDSNLLHKGGDNQKKAIQLKIIHKKDIEKLPNLNNYFVINNENYKSSLFNYYFNKFIIHIPFLIDFNYKIISDCFNKEKNSFLQKIVCYFLFNNYRYFDIDNNI